MNDRIEHADTVLSKDAPDHPLDPLSAAELTLAASIIRAHFEWGEDLRVETIDLDEPAKDVVRGHPSGADWPRVARFNVYRRGAAGVWQGRVDLRTGVVTDKTLNPSARPMVAVEEVLLIEKTVKADPRFQDALRRLAAQELHRLAR